MPIIQATHLTKVFPGTRKNKADVTAVNDVSLGITEGDIFGVIGYSGSGKSTLVRLINALERPTSGEVAVLGESVTDKSEAELRTLRRSIGMIFQQFNLFSSRTVYGNIEYPLIIAGVKPDDRHARVVELLRFVGLADKAFSYPNSLSGGQKQRVGIARALATSPRILLADEPTSALDPETTQDVLALLRRVNHEFGVTIVLITHEMAVIRAIADRVAVFDRGRIVEEGTVYDVFANPQSETAKRFVRTVLPSAPTGDTLRSLIELYADTLVGVPITDHTGSLEDAVALFTRAGLTATVVHGGLDDVHGQAVGYFTLHVTGDAKAITDAAAASTWPLTLIAAQED